MAGESDTSNNRPRPRYRRILLKLSGEALMGRKPYGIDWHVLETYAREIRQVVELGVAVGIVIGGGNIFRGVQNASRGMKRPMPTTWACWPP